jgi:hypothetical protein
MQRQPQEKKGGVASGEEGQKQREEWEEGGGEREGEGKLPLLIH